MGEQVQRMSMNYRSNFARLAQTLVGEYGDTTRAIHILDRCMEIMPVSKIPYNYFSIYIADGYYQCGEFEKGNKLMLDILEKYKREIDWFNDLDEQKMKLVKSEIDRSESAIQTIGALASRYKMKEVTEKAQEYMTEISGGMSLR